MPKPKKKVAVKRTPTTRKPTAPAEKKPGLRRHPEGISLGVAQLVKDWGGFERLVKSMHQDGVVKVRRGEKLKGRGGTWTVDVTIRHQHEGRTDLTLVECKYWTTPVDRTCITNLAVVKEETGAKHAVVFTTIGYDSGAEEFAKSRGIEVYVVRDLMPTDWGAPGRVVTFQMQSMYSAIGDVQIVAIDPFPENMAPEEIKLIRQGGATVTLAEYFSEYREQNLKALGAQVLSGDGKFTWRILGNTQFPGGFWQAEYRGHKFRMLGFSATMMVHIQQEALVVDRGDFVKYALAVEEKVTGKRLIASRKMDSRTSVMDPIKNEPITEPTVPNNLPIAILDSNWYSYEELLAEFESQVKELAGQSAKAGGAAE